ncbi:hypothetical protein B0H14DRAFT_2632500 [Mycena olivaceomarginata]|nr:hypothetical protein B0H14DRAFT_2632500 [Mycena olivaceomarginata]
MSYASDSAAATTETDAPVLVAAPEMPPDASVSTDASPRRRVLVRCFSDFPFSFLILCCLPGRAHWRSFCLLAPQLCQSPGPSLCRPVGGGAPSFLSSPPQPLASIPVLAGDEELWYCILKGKFVGVTQNHPLAVNAVLGVSNNSNAQLQDPGVGTCSLQQRPRWYYRGGATVLSISISICINSSIVSITPAAK